MSDVIRKIDLHVKLETVECTSMFFEQFEFPSKYSIIKINENVFGIVNNETNVCKITFTQIIKLYKDRYVYLITTPERTFILLKYVYGEEFYSDPFNHIVELFHRYALIEDFNNKRFLVSTEPDNVDITFKEWFKNSTKDWAQVDLFREDDKGEVFNYKKTIILKDGLKYSNVKFYFASAIYDDYLELFFEKDDKRSIIDTNNLRLYPGYFKCISDRIKGSDGNLYVIAQTNNNDEYIIRLNDYHSTRKQYESVSFINDSYAEAIDGDKRLIIRLKDFNEVYFD